MARIKAGDRVLIRRAVGDVEATVLSLFGPPDNQFARLVMELPGVGEDDTLGFQAVTLPVDLLSRPSAA